MHDSRLPSQFRRFGGLAAFLLATALAAPPFGNHKDDRLGFTIQTPNKWTAIPMGGDERWMVAKYLSDKTYFWTDKKGGWTQDHQPDMQVIAFVEAAVKEKVKLIPKEKRNGRIEWILAYESPFKNYKDFLGKRYTGGGWFVSEEKEDKVGDVPVTCYQIKVDKQSENGPKRMVTWVYHVPDVDIAVQFETLEDAWPKLSGEIMKCLRSFKTVERSGEALYEASTAGDKTEYVDEEKLTPDQRKSRRAALEKAYLDKATAKLTDGWTAKRMGHFMVLNHGDEKFAKRVVDQAEAVWKWLDDSFPFIGEGEYVRTPILRICKDQAEYEGFIKGQNWFSVFENEISAYDDNGGATGWESKWVNRKVLQFWLRDRDRGLYAAMPGWIGIGLSNLVENLHMKNGKITFRKDEWNRDDVREAARNGRATPPKDIFVMTTESYGQDWLKIEEAEQLVDYLAARGGAKDKRTKDVLPEYLKNLIAVVGDVEKEDKASAGKTEKKATTEAEEDAQFKHRRDNLKQREQRILEDTFRRTFGAWTESDWKAFQDGYEKAVH